MEWKKCVNTKACSFYIWALCACRVLHGPCLLLLSLWLLWLKLEVGFGVTCHGVLIPNPSWSSPQSEPIMYLLVQTAPLFINKMLFLPSLLRWGSAVKILLPPAPFSQFEFQHSFSKTQLSRCSGFSWASQLQNLFWILWTMWSCWSANQPGPKVPILVQNHTAWESPHNKKTSPRLSCDLRFKYLQFTFSFELSHWWNNYLSQDLLLQKADKLRTYMIHLVAQVSAIQPAAQSTLPIALL